jgi:glycosyltransferase involved in cell wall biosynthesis
VHVGYVLKKFPRNSETFILNEVLALQRAGVQVSIFSLNRPDDGVFHRALAELANPITYLQPRRPDAWLEVMRAHWPRLARALPRLLAEFEDLLLGGRPDLWTILGHGFDLALQLEERGVQRMHAHFATVAAYVARAANAFTGVPFSVTCHAKDIYRDGVTAQRFTSLLRPADFAVTVCEANKRHIVDNLGGAALDVRVLYNGVDVAAFHPKDRRADPQPTILAVGRLVEKKGFHVLLEALALLAQQGQRPRCWLVGDGEERGRLEAQAASLGLQHVEFLGMRTQDEVGICMARATVMVLPCIVGADGNRDALPTVLLEALAAGLPTISSPVGGVEEIADHGRAGVLVEPGSAAATARAIHDLLRDPARQAALARAGRARAEQCFDLTTNVAQLRAWYENGARAPGAVA